MNIHFFATALAAVIIGMPVSAHATSHGTSQSTTRDEQAAHSSGEVRKVDRETKKVTVRHGPIPNLEMPAMTMVFQVRDPAMLDQLKAGDKIRFLAAKDEGVYVLTRIETIK